MKESRRNCARSGKLNLSRLFKAAEDAAPRCPVMSEPLEPRRLLSSVNITGTTLNYIASPGEANTLSITLAAGVFTITDAAGVTITPGAGAAGGGAPGVPATAADTGVTQINVVLDDGNDTAVINAAVSSLISGGEGNDTITGSSVGDTIHGDAGNDILLGVAGTDAIHGGEGNDRFGDPAVRDPAANDSGNDQFFGEGGSDEFFWDPGDGDDQIEGGAGDSDQIFFFGNAGAEQFFLFADTISPSRFHLFRVQAAIDINAADVEEVNLSSQGGTDTVTVGRSDLGVLSDLSTTTVQAVDVSLGTDGAADSVIFEGRPIEDNLLVSVSSGIVKVAGLSYDLRIDGNEPADRLTINANESNDTVTAAAGTSTVMALTFSGGAGNDFLDASATTGTGVTLEGDAGDDTLFGGSGNDSMRGEAVAPAGNDTFLGNGGTDAVGAGPGLLGDRILVPGTSGNDVIDLAWNGSGHLLATINGVTTTYTDFVGGAISNSGIELVAVTGDAGTDEVAINGATLPTIVDLGAGNDLARATGGSAARLTLLGGVGDDALFGGAAADRLEGGEGNDMMVGGVGDDTAYGGAGSDTMVWSPGDSDDLFEGDEGNDTLAFAGANGNDTYTTFSDNGRVIFQRQPGNVAVNMGGVENIIANSETIQLNGRNEVPANSSPANGFANFTYNPANGTFDIRMFVTGLTSAIIDSHIHMNVPGANGPVVIPFGPGFTPVAGGFELVLTGLTLANIAPPGGFTAQEVLMEILLGRAYFNIHTTNFPGGEVRGNIIAPSGPTAGSGGADSLTVGDMTGTSLQSIVFDAGNEAEIRNGAALVDTVTVNGLNTPDAITAGVPNALDNNYLVSGLPYNILVTGSDGTIANGTSRDTLIINGNGGNDTLTALFDVDNITRVTLNGGTGDDTLSADGTLNGNDDNDILRGGPGDNTLDGGAGDDTFIGNGGTDAVGGGTGSSVGDTILLPGTSGNDTFTLSFNGSGHLVSTINGVTTTYTNFLGGPIGTSGIEQILAQGDNGADTFNVTPGSVPIFLDGGDAIGVLPGDHINIAGPATLNAGPEGDEGDLETAGNQPVSFDDIESITVFGGSGSVINATNGDDSISIIARDGSTHASADGVQDLTVSINGGVEVLYLNTPTLTVNALGGSDEIAVKAPAPNNAVWDVDLTIDGGLPTASDTVIFGTPGTDTASFTPTGADSGTLNITNLSSLTTLSEVEHLTYDGENGGDSFTNVGTGGADTIVHTPGAGNDEGTVQVNSLLAVNYQNLGAGTLTVDGAGGPDTLVARGTDTSDTFGVAAGGAVSLNSRLVLNQSAVENLNLAGLDGDDTFNIAGVLPYSSTIVDAGDPSASDIVNLSGASGAVNVTFGSTSTVTGYGGVVSLLGVETLNANANNQNLTITGTSGDDTIAVTPTGSASATALLASSMPAVGATPVVNGSNIGNLTVDAQAGVDQLVVNGTAVGETYNVDGDSVERVGREIVKYASIDHVIINGLAGSDTFNVLASAVSVFVDGGDPIGTTAGDFLDVDNGGSPMTFEAGPQNDEGAFVVTGKERVSFDRIEALSGGGGGGPISFGATNANDQITVIARDASTHLGADGVQDFTISFNASPDFLFLNTPTLNINALSGDDVTTVRAPAPNGADWNVQVTINSGAPSASDKVIVETPGTTTAIYTPSAFDGGSLRIKGVANDSTITLIETEQLTYSGMGGNDTLQVWGVSATNNLTLTPGAAADAGTVAKDLTLPLSFSSLGAAGALVFQAVGTSALTYNGTNANDSFIISNISTAGKINLGSRIPVRTTGVQTLSLQGFAGDDTFTLLPALQSSPFNTINIQAGGQASGTGDKLTLTGTAGADVFNATGQIVFAGGKVVNGNGLEDIAINTLGGSDEIIYQGVNGVSEAINVNASPTAASGQIKIAGVARYTFQGVESIVAHGNNGSAGDTDTLTFSATNNPDKIIVKANATGTAADPILKLQTAAGAQLLTLRNYTNFSTLNINALDGADAIDVYTGANIGRNVFINGGLPTAKNKETDVLRVFYVSNPKIVRSTATQNPGSGLVSVDYTTSKTLVQYADMETVSVIKL